MVVGRYYSLKKGHAFDLVERRVTTLANLPFDVSRPTEATRLLSFFPLDA